MEYFRQKYRQLCVTPLDINEHLPTLMKYASECESVLELGVRGVVSSWALSFGLLNNNKARKYLLMNDLTSCDIDEIVGASKLTDLVIDYKWIDDLMLPKKAGETFDLVFIDTWHIYGQLKRELNYFAPITNKYIIMHDTTVDEWLGETIRCNWNAKEQAKSSGMLEEEINMGLWPAVVEFISNNSEWKVKERFNNNNGLTILERKTFL